ncbi:hypothetical protein MANES_08G120800v8 [Manihot esculenta]|uniref:Uncharacterized protein n=1 Tax=Manihot esculenta TaxID=3983 RepID=A0ACB7HA80_MANES|nr:hypothetical protein MANES_08G120800v8 [Manihot esculenta]
MSCFTHLELSVVCNYGSKNPPKQSRIAAPLNPVDKCMARLQELQSTVTGGRGYMRTSLRCKQESLRIRSATPKKSPVGKMRESLVETVGEILQSSQFAREIVAPVACKTNKTTIEDPKTPLTQLRKQRPNSENTKSKRKKEKQDKLQSIRSQATSPSLRRARSRINFKVQQKFYRTRSPVIPRNKQTTPHKFFLKSSLSTSKFQVKIKSSPVVSLLPTEAANFSKKSPTRAANLSKKSPKVFTASKLRLSFSPSRLANGLVSPLTGRKNVQKIDGFMSGLKQRPVSMPRRFSLGRIKALLILVGLYM